MRAVLVILALVTSGFGQDVGHLRGRLVGDSAAAARMELWSARQLEAEDSGPDGRFALACPDLQPGEDLRLVLPGGITYQLFDAAKAALVAGEDVDLGDVHVGAGVTVNGRLVGEDGSLLLGIVYVRGGVHPSRLMALLGDWNVPIDRNTGEFHFAGLPPGPLRIYSWLDFDVNVSSAILDPVLEGAFASVDLEAGSEHYQVLTVEAFPEIEVELDPSPLPDHLFHARGLLSSPIGGRSLGQGPIGGKVKAPAGIEPVMQLRFTSEEIEPVLDLFHADDGPVVVPVRPSSGVNLTVPDATSFRVSASPRVGDDWSEPIEFGSFQATAQVRLTPGFWLLEVEAPGLPPQQRALRVDRAIVAPLELRPRRATTLSVQVNGGPSDVPVTALPVHVEYGPVGLSIASSSLRTDETGHAQLTDFVPGPARIGVAFGPSLMRWADLEDGATEVTITAPPAGWVDVRVSAPEHVDLPSVLARVRKDVGSRLASFYEDAAVGHALDADGRVRLGPVLAGRRQVQLMRPGLLWEDLGSIDVSPGEVALIASDERKTFPATVTVALEPSLAQAGRFNVDLRGAQGLRLQRVSSLFGRVTFAGVPPGAYTVWCEPVNCTWAYHDLTEVVVGPGQQTEHTVSVPLVEREVSFQGPDGKAWSLRPFLYSVAEGHVHLRRTDKDGTWSVALPPGTLRVWPVTRDLEDATVLAWAAGEEPLIVILEP